MSDHDQDPFEAMMPPADNPEYHKQKAAHRDQIQGAAETAVMSDPSLAGMGERMTRVRQGAPAPTPPQPLPQASAPAAEANPRAAAPGTGIAVDPSMAQVEHAPVEHRLPPELQAAPEPVVTPPPPIAAPVSDGKVSPILAKLKEDFGIESIPLQHIKVNDHVFTMRVLDTGSVTQALRFADTLSLPGSERENAINTQIALTAFAIVAIDDEPVYEVFGVKVPDHHLTMVEGRQRVVFNPMTPPTDVRILAATQLMDFLSGQATGDLLATLWTKYGEEVDPQGALENLMETIRAGEAEEPDVPLP